MKRYFVTGLVLLLPVALTLIIVLFVFNLLTEPFVGFTSDALRHLGLTYSDTLLFIISRLLIVLVLFGLTVLLGLLGHMVLARFFFGLWESLLNRIPLVRSIYKTTQDVTSTLFTNSSRSFKQVVLVRFPNEHTHSVGFVTRDDINDLPAELGKLIAVFVPTTPNPTSGFLMLYSPSDVIFLDMTVEDALKYVISCGVIASPFNNSERKITG